MEETVEEEVHEVKVEKHVGIGAKVKENDENEEQLELKLLLDEVQALIHQVGGLKKHNGSVT